MATVLEVSGVTKSFRRGKPVLKDIGLEVEAGEFVGLIGASGSGKSTLIRVLCGLERADVGPGWVALFGETTQAGGRRTKAQRRLRSRVGVVFQQFNLVGRLSLLQNVLVGRLGHTSWARGVTGVFAGEDKIRALACLERVGMAEHARQRASVLSGGQQQRGAIARALTQEADIILADEPIASLDPAAADRVMEILADINAKEGVTVVVSLHQIDHAFKHCKRIVALKAGRVVYDGPTSDVTPEDLNGLYHAMPAKLTPAPQATAARVQSEGAELKTALPVRSTHPRPPQQWRLTAAI